MKKQFRFITINDVQVPEKIGHAYSPVEVLDLSLLKQEPLMNHRRLRVFANKGLQCSYCPKEGAFLIKAKDRFGNVHIDLYTEKFELMTIDHIIPKCKQGPETLENLTPACDRCNGRKGDRII
jgi:5-methylcytosine-specific restriction endonuclease McrA